MPYNKQGFYQEGSISKFSPARLGSFKSVWKAVTDRDAVPGRKVSCPLLGQKRNYCNIWRTSVSEHCYRWLTLFTIFWYANDFKIYVGAWFVTRMYEKNTYTLWVRWGFTKAYEMFCIKHCNHSTEHFFCFFKQHEKKNIQYLF